MPAVTDEPPPPSQATPPPHATAPAGGTMHEPELTSVEADHGATLPAPRSRLKGGLPPRTLRRVCDYVDAHLGESLDNMMLAAIAGLSMSHFVRAFKQSEGLTPHRYVIRRRVERAKKLLAGTDLRLAEIAGMAGFADQSHCARCFREHAGMRPRDYRWSMR